MIDIDRILLEIERYVPEYVGQISLQTVPGNLDPMYGTGRVNDIENSGLDTLDPFEVRRARAIQTELAFTEPTFPEMEYTNKIIKDLGMFRTRLMVLNPYQCYSYHVDPTQRIHIPLITNPNCFMIIDDILYRYPADGNYYLADTTKVHTFVNASKEDRLHIVGGTLQTQVV